MKDEQEIEDFKEQIYNDFANLMVKYADENGMSGAEVTRVFIPVLEDIIANLYNALNQKREDGLDAWL